MTIHAYLAGEYPIRLAHRGSRILWPENTLEAFQGAIDLGYRYIETDVQLTADGTVVVFHDDDLDRLTNAVGPIRAWRWEDVQHLDAAWFFGSEAGYPMRYTGCRISSLEEIFATFPDVCFNIDIKCGGAEWAVADVIRRWGREESVLVGGFVDRRTARFRRITKGQVATSAGRRVAVAMWSASRVGRTVRRPEVAYQVPYDYTPRLDRKFIDAVHRAGAQVHAWTVNEIPDMIQLLDMGVDGIVTDRPDLLNDVVANRGDGG
jgi:glycerophosphoryl diester phosphodiesterase